jgi:hypothetical protein
MVADIPSKVGFNLNKKLTALVNQWQAIGSPGQEGFDWTSSKQNWEKAFPIHKKFISELPKEIDRVAVRNICESARYSILEKFLSVMVWGYGDRGYGPYRVTQMLKQENTEEILTHVFKTCRQGEPKLAYDLLKQNRIRILGPSYGSKFLTFCTPREIGAPIYDSLLAIWVEQFAKKDFLGVPTSSENWNLKTYSRYWDWVKHHSEALGAYPDEIELVLFRDAESRFSKSTNWSGK